MKLTDIHLNYKTDKGTGHNYIDTYENLFSSIRTQKLNVLEIGVLLGGSLKMWEYYFENSMIYGVDDFSQSDTNSDFGEEYVDAERVKKELFDHTRIKFIECDSRNKNTVDNKIGSLGVEFDIIIDDGEHSIPCQIDNFNNFIPFLKDTGIYIVEDCQSLQEAEYLKEYILNTYDGPNVEIVPLNIKERKDDILLIIK
jgi:hypothetical protein